MTALHAALVLSLLIAAAAFIAACAGLCLACVALIGKHTEGTDA
jgi:hypothetical protein